MEVVASTSSTVEDSKTLEGTALQDSITRDTSRITTSSHKLQTWEVSLNQRQERWLLPLSHKRMKTRDGVMLEPFLIEI